MPRQPRRSLATTTALVTQVVKHNPDVLDVSKVNEARAQYTKQVDPENGKPVASSLDDATIWSIFCKHYEAMPTEDQNADWYGNIVDAMCDMEAANNAPETEGDKFPPDPRIAAAVEVLNNDTLFNENASEHIEANETARRWWLECTSTLLHSFVTVPVNDDNRAQAQAGKNDLPWYLGYSGPFAYSAIHTWPIAGSKAPKLEDGDVAPPVPANGYDVTYEKRLDTGKAERTSFTQRLADMTATLRGINALRSDFFQAGGTVKSGGSGKLTTAAAIAYNNGVAEIDDISAQGIYARLTGQRKYFTDHMRDAIRVVSMLGRINTLPKVKAYIATREIISDGNTRVQFVEHDKLFVIAENRPDGLRYSRNLSEFLALRPEKAIEKAGNKPENVTVSDVTNSAAKVQVTGNGIMGGQGAPQADKFKVTLPQFTSVATAFAAFVENPTLLISVQQLMNNPDISISDPVIGAMAKIAIATCSAMVSQPAYAERADKLLGLAAGSVTAALDVNHEAVKKTAAKVG